MIYIKFYKEIKLEMIKHCMEVPSKECGGFLYGNIIKKNEDIFCEVDAIYYERRYGSDCDFNFALSYIYNAKKQLENLKSQYLIGTYHSHGLYPAIFSEVDRNQLQPYFGTNKITMIYSPAYSKLVGEYLDLNDESKKTKIITR